ncbi:MAG TPA: hypothetical protein VFJ58_09730 [Armatimonadota bacterium]|nr:hypothetical protein [Armatimonadota bacterium]
MTPQQTVASAAVPAGGSRLSRCIPALLVFAGLGLGVRGILGLVTTNGVYTAGLTENAGVVQNGSSIRHSVFFRNLTRQPVEVISEPGCGCTIADVPDRTIPAFGSASVKVTVHTGLTALGPQTKMVQFLLLSGRNSWQKTLQIRMIVRGGKGAARAARKPKGKDLSPRRSTG